MGDNKGLIWQRRTLRSSVPCYHHPWLCRVLIRPWTDAGGQWGPQWGCSAWDRGATGRGAQADEEGQGCRASELHLTTWKAASAVEGPGRPQEAGLNATRNTQVSGEALLSLQSKQVHWEASTGTRGPVITKSQTNHTSLLLMEQHSACSGSRQTFPYIGHEMHLCPRSFQKLDALFGCVPLMKILECRSRRKENITLWNIRYYLEASYQWRSCQGGCHGGVWAEMPSGRSGSGRLGDGAGLPKTLQRGPQPPLPCVTSAIPSRASQGGRGRNWSGWPPPGATSPNAPPTNPIQLEVCCVVIAWVQVHAAWAPRWSWVHPDPQRGRAYLKACAGSGSLRAALSAHWCHPVQCCVLNPGSSHLVLSALCTRQFSTFECLLLGFKGFPRWRQW